MTELRRYRKTATVLAEQIPPGETRLVQTLEGPATGSGPDWVLRANTERGERWIVPDDFFTGPDGYDRTGEIVDGLPVCRKKPTADVLAYVVQTDDHEPVPLYGAEQLFRPPKGYRIVTGLRGTDRRAVEPSGFDRDFEPADFPDFVKSR
jgi:hypothetical protein